MGGGSAGGVTSVLADAQEDPGTSGNPASRRPSARRSRSGGTPTDEFIDRSDTPTIYFHGTEDTTVPFAWAVLNAAAMYNAGIFTVLYPFPGERDRGVLGAWKKIAGGSLPSMYSFVGAPPETDTAAPMSDG